MKALSLFSGIGGIDLAAEWAGIETVAFCEREPFCQKVLKKHWPDIPIYDDVCTLTKERLEADGIGTIDLIHGGYPCQPFSIAGKREGEDDDRYLWPEVFRLLQEKKPKWFVGENVAGHIEMGLDIVLSDLESMSYTWETFIIPSAAIGASHRRDRVLIIANTMCERLEGLTIQGFEQIAVDEWEKKLSKFNHNSRSKNRYYAEAEILRMDDGVPNRMDRFKSLGNAVNPYQIYPILAAIKQINDMLQAI